MKSIKNIEYTNKVNPNSKFDFVDLERLFQGVYKDHSIEQHHKVGFYVILFIKQGNGTHTINSVDYPCSKGTLITIRKDQIHKFSRSEDLKGSLLVFTDDFLVSYLEKLEAQKSLLLFNESLANPKIQLNDSEYNDIKHLFYYIEKEYFGINDSFQMRIIRSVLHILVSKLYRIKLSGEDLNFETKHVERFIEFQLLLEANVFKTRKVIDYAQKMGMSTKSLNAIVNSVVHKSAKKFVDEICIKLIKQSLINTEMSFKEIAYQSGFDEIPNFYKYFSRHTGTTPEKFRKSA